MENKISIVVPVYNVEPYLKRCLDSVLAQTWEQWECILVNDGSKDNSLEIAKAYAEQDSRFRVVSQENQGLSAARNKGIELSTGNYISFLDSDDAIAPTFLERLWQVVDKYDADAAVCTYLRFSSEKIPAVLDVLGQETVLTAEEAVKKILVDRKRHMITAWGKLYKRELLKEIRYPVGKMHEDEFVTYKIFAHCRKVAEVSDGMYFYFERADSIMGKYKIKRLDALEAFHESLEFISKEMPELYGKVFVNYLFNLAIAYYRVSTLKDQKDINREIRKAFLKIWQEYKRCFRKECGGIKKAALYIFRICPGLFCAGARLYLKVADDD